MIDPVGHQAMTNERPSLCLVQKGSKRERQMAHTYFIKEQKTVLVWTFFLTDVTLFLLILSLNKSRSTFK